MTDSEFAEYWTSLVRKKQLASYHGLSTDERIFYAANLLRGSVPRSGLIGYFENTDFDSIRDVEPALRVLGLGELLRILEDARRIVLQDREVVQSDRFLTLFDEHLSEEEEELARERLDECLRDFEERFNAQDRLFFDALCRFADSRNLRAIQR